MLEILLCSLFTIVPDYLYRRYGQGKRIGSDITIYSVWYELRYGITSCVILAVALITIIFYFHPSTTSAVAFFRTVPILPEASGRVDEVFVGVSDKVDKGAPLFRLDNSRQKAALELSKRRIVEADAALQVADADILTAEGQIQQAKGAHEQALEELQTKELLNGRSPGTVAMREIERLRKVVEGRAGAVNAATATKRSAELKATVLLPAEKASAEAARDQSQVDLDKTLVTAGVAGRVEQFLLRPGDVVNPMVRPAGLLIPSGAGRGRLQAGFGQIEAQVIRPGMIGEATCVSMPWKIIPLVVTDVQEFISAGQVRASEQLIDPRQVTRPGSILVYLEGLYEGAMDEMPPGSSCITNIYSNHHDIYSRSDVGQLNRVFLHMVDAVGIVHAMLLRVQAFVLPVKVLVGSPH